jgi:hypothetical protein
VFLSHHLRTKRRFKVGPVSGPDHFEDIIMADARGLDNTLQTPEYVQSKMCANMKSGQEDQADLAQICL